ncbi:MAG: hypothetical protein RI567_13715 [Marinobacter sp.]|nr:hypothetical protein [Marinobacter sp.]
MAWTFFIKYLFPIGFALASNEAWATYIYQGESIDVSFFETLC